MQTMDRRSFLALSAATLAGAALPAARAAAFPARRWAGDLYFSWQELREGVHAAVDLSMGGNVLVLTSGETALLVDTKFPAFGVALAREGAGFGAPVMTVINTHHHGDHTGGNAVLHPGRTLIAHARAAERIAGQVSQYTGAARGGPKQVDMDRPGADLVLEEAQAAAAAAPGWTPELFVPDEKIDTWPHELKVGEVRVVLYHFGAGHTDNDVVVHLPDLNIVHTGDVCFHGLHPYFDPAGGATCRGWSASVSKVVDLCDGETVVVPGHGEATNRDGLETQKIYLDRIWDHVAEEIRGGKTKDEVKVMSWDFMDGLGFGQVRERAIDAVYDEVSRSS